MSGSADKTGTKRIQKQTKITRRTRRYHRWSPSLQTSNTILDCSRHDYQEVTPLYYLTIKQADRIKQLTFEELCFGSVDLRAQRRINTTDDTVTFCLKEVPEKYVSSIDVRKMIATLKRFNKESDILREVNRHSLYYSFKIPKKKKVNGRIKWRQIDAPFDPLMKALRSLKQILETEFFATHHTAAYAYVPGREILHALRKHQRNGSRWYAKFDFSNFFGSHTHEYCMSVLSHVFPFCEVMKVQEGRKELSKALELAFLDDRLPQGTPISPMLTNILMIPFDYLLSKRLREANSHLVYTRYADDLQISSRYDFSPKEIEKIIQGVVAELEAPYLLNTSKTRYGSINGSNWNLGLMTNKDNQITVGAERKKELKTLLFNYAMDRLNCKRWFLVDIQSLLGKLRYVEHIEGDAACSLVNRVSRKVGFDIEQALLYDIKTTNCLI